MSWGTCWIMELISSRVPASGIEPDPGAIPGLTAYKAARPIGELRRHAKDHSRTTNIKRSAAAEKVMRELIAASGDQRKRA